MLIVTPIVGFCNCFMVCCAFLCTNSSIAIILMWTRELIALLFCLPGDYCVALPHGATDLSAVFDCGIS